MPNECQQVWYHGSPLRLTLLRAGSTITRDRRLAEVFSHKPALVSVTDTGEIKHTGVALGWLYRIDEEVAPADVYAHPRTTMAPGMEWLTNRPLRLTLIGPVEIGPEERLSDQEIQELRQQQESMERSPTGGQEGR